MKSYADKSNVLMVLKRKRETSSPLSTGCRQSCFSFFDQSGERYFVEYGDVVRILRSISTGLFQAIDGAVKYRSDVLLLR
ncbi:hypothetical protein ACPA9J_23610 [Pseudomonas aeruginosa]